MLIDYKTSFYVNYQWINYYNAIRYMSIINNLRYWNYCYFQNFVSFWANFFDLHHGFHYTRDLLGKFLQQSSERYASCVTNDFSQDTDKMGKNPLLLVFTTSTIQISFATKPRRINIIERNSSRRLAFFSFFIKAASLFDQRSEKPLTLLPFEDGNARSKC